MPNTTTPLEEMIAAERDPAVPSTELYGMSSLMRRWWLDGDWHTHSELTALLGASGSLSGQVAKQLKALGFTFDEETYKTEPGADGRPRLGKRLRCTNATTHKLTPEIMDAYRESMEAAKNRKDASLARAINEAKERAEAKAAARAAKQAAKQSKQEQLDVAEPERAVAVVTVEQPTTSLSTNGVPLPHVDAELTVYLSMRDRDGTMRLGLRNGSSSWIAVIEAHADES